MYKQRSRRQVARTIKKKVENAIKLAEVDSICELHNYPSCSCASGGSSIRVDNTIPSTSGGDQFEQQIDTESRLQNEFFEVHSNDSFTNLYEGDNNHIYSGRSANLNDDDSGHLPVSNVVNEAEENSTASFLKQWSLRNNITHLALSQLLKFFSTNPDIRNLPKDARTLLGTPVTTSIIIEDMGEGQFYYFGLQNKLKAFITSQSQTISVLNLQFNIDGMQIHKSKNLSFWPILCLIENSKSSVFPVAIYSGQSKPPLEEYLKKFVEELRALVSTGLITNNIHIPIKVAAFCCDAPARSYIKNVKAFNGIYGCDKCICKGILYNKRRVFLNVDAALRTNQSFLQRSNAGHHKGDTPLSQLPIDLIADFPLDYMHCVCLGVMRKLLFLWRDGPRSVRLKKVDLVILNNRLKAASRRWPSDFNRKPRPLKELERWKATELRQFLLYLGPVVLKDLLTQNVYCNFELFHYAMTILLNQDLNLLYNQYANSLLKLFVKHAVNVYGKEFCIYNVHVLTHLANDARQYNTLQNVNCFVFENYLGSLKRLLRKSNLPLQQVVRRLKEIDNLSSPLTLVPNLTVGFVGCSSSYVTEHIRSKFEGTFYSMYQFPTSLVSCKTGDNCIFLKSGAIVQIRYFIDDQSNINKMIGTKYTILQPFVNYPTCSSVLNLYEVALDNQDFKVYLCNEFLSKGLLLKFNETLVCMPLVH